MFLRRLIRIAALTLVLLGCDDHIDMTGKFVEVRQSPRLIAGVDADLPTMHFFRFIFQQYGDDAAGIVEVYNLPNFDAFAETADFLKISQTNYYCTRFDYAGVRAERAIFGYTDSLNRHWLVRGDIVDDQLKAVFSRRDAYNREVEPSACSGFYPEDLAWINKASDGATDQIKLKQVDNDPNETDLQCPQHYKTSTLNVDIPLKIDDSCNHYRLAIITSLPQISSITGRLTSIKLNQFATASLDSYDLQGTTRQVKLTASPDLQVDYATSFGFATVIIYEDLPPYDDVWQNLLPEPSHREPILAYLPDQVIAFNAETLTPDLAFVSVTGESIPVVEGTWDKLGWHVFSPRFQIELIQRAKYRRIVSMQSDNNRILNLTTIENSCQNCYPSNPEDPACGDCDAIFPFAAIRRDTL